MNKSTLCVTAMQMSKWNYKKKCKLKCAVWHPPATWVKHWHVCERLVWGWVIGGIRWARVGHRCSFLIFIALLGSSLLSFCQFRLLAVHQQRLMMKRLLMRWMERGKLDYTSNIRLDFQSKRIFDMSQQTTNMRIATLMQHIYSFHPPVLLNILHHRQTFHT